MMEYFFTVSEANDLISWLEDKFRQIDPYRVAVEKNTARAQQLLGVNRSNGSSHLETELQRLTQLIEEMRKSIQDLVGQITGKGIIVRNLEAGLLDFPGKREKRTVHLCWLRGEAEVGFWHEVDAGFPARQPI